MAAAPVTARPAGEPWAAVADHVPVTDDATVALSAPGVAPASGRGVRVAVTVTGALIGACAFAFSFGNVWHLALAWGVPAPIAPLIAPMLDISVVGLMISIRNLALNGISARRLWGARFLMLVCAATTWGLNIAQAALAHRWGGVVIDSVAPAQLLGWAEVGPTLLRLSATPTPEAPRRPMAAAPARPASARTRAGRTPPAHLPRLHLGADGLTLTDPTSHRDSPVDELPALSPRRAS